MNVRFQRFVLSCTFLLVLCLCNSCRDNRKQDIFSTYEDRTAIAYGPYRIIRLPITKGVTIQNPIQISAGPGGIIYASNASGAIYRLVDSDSDGVEDEAGLYCSVADNGLHNPGGFAYRGDTVFIGTREEIRAYIDIDKDGKADSSWTFFKDIPQSEHPYEWISGLCFGKDNYLYGAITTDSWNAGASPDPRGYRGAIIRISPDGKQAERLATGIRSVYGMSFHPDGTLYFADNEGGGNPTEELNRLVPGKFYGHNAKKYKPTDSTEKPVLSFQMELAPSGMEFNSTDNDFGGTGGDLFVAFYGPAERWKRGGIARVRISKAESGKIELAEYPVADIPKLSDLAFGRDGSLYAATHGVADYWYNPIQESSGGFYKLVYDPKRKGKTEQQRSVKQETFSSSSLEKGKDLYKTTACFACHTTEDGQELLGPTLNGLGNRMSREEIYESIMNPSAIIKPSMEGTKITLKDGKVLLGRIVNANEQQFDLMLIGNKVFQVKRTEIATIETQKKSLMYEGLIKNLPKADQESLLDYLQSLK